MAQYDIESFLTALEAFLKANLNTYISAVTTEKGDSMTLLTVDSSAYFFQSFTDGSLNYNPFVFYGIADTKSEGEGPGTLKIYSVDVVIGFVDTGADFYTGRRQLRYARALTDLFEQKWASIGVATRLKIQQLTPFNFPAVNADLHRGAGVTLEVVLG